MSIEERTSEHIDRILSKAERVISSAEIPEEEMQKYRNALDNGDIDEWWTPQPNNGVFIAWKTQALVFLKGLLPENHSYIMQFQHHVRSNDLEDVQAGQELLIAVKEDLESGLLTSIRNLVASELFDDFLDMAEYLNEEGYKDAAASLAGAVLEDSLRKLASYKDIKVKEREDINSLAQKCADNEVYGRFTQKKISVYADIRNSSAHGKFDEYSGDDVADMIRGIRMFLSEYLE